jgi:hypothetical protein
MKLAAQKCVSQSSVFWPAVFADYLLLPSHVGPLEATVKVRSPLLVAQLA